MLLHEPKSRDMGQKEGASGDSSYKGTLNNVVFNILIFISINYNKWSSFVFLFTYYI